MNNRSSTVTLRVMKMLSIESSNTIPSFTTVMPMTLGIPCIPRRKSDTCLNVVNSMEEHRKTGAISIDQSLLEVLRKNYDFVSALADIEDPPDLPPIHIENNVKKEITDGYGSTTSISSMAGIQCSHVSWFRSMMSSYFSDVAEAFKTPREALPSGQTEQSKLSATALRRDLKRCFAALHPLIEVGAALQDIVLWRNPVTTLLLSLVFFYSIVRGWTASLLLLLLLLQLSLNYLRTVRSIDIGLCFLPRRHVPSPQFDITGAQLIFDIAHVVQDLLNFGANVFEKAYNLMTWKDESVSFVFFCLVVYWLMLSLVFNTGTCLGMCAFTLGIRIFITTYLFEKFPLLRRQLGTYEWFYRNLSIKTNEEQSHEIPREGKYTCSLSFFKKSSSEHILRTSSPAPSVHLQDSDPLYGSNTQLSPSEDDVEEPDPAMEGVVTWRDCVLYIKDRPFPKSLISGAIYLTEIALVFRAKSAAGNNQIPPLTLFNDIVSVKKINTLRTVGLIAGSRKAIEITLAHKRRPILLMGVHERDEFVEKMKEVCQKAEAPTHFIIDEDD